MHHSILCIAALAAATTLPAQAPDLFVQPHAQQAPGSAFLTWNVFGTPGAVFAVFADTAPGPNPILGAPVNLGLSNDLITLQLGVLSVAGASGGAVGFQAPPALAGQAFYIQHVEGDPNNIATATAGVPESIVFHDGSRRILDDFRAQGQRWTGTFDRVPHRMQGAAVTTRTHVTIDRQGVPFGLGVANPLNPAGSRTQMVFRPQDVGATGTPELLTAVRWRPVGPVVVETLGNFTLNAAHSTVTPNYNVDPFTGLPVAPSSGLNEVFDRNPDGGGYAVLSRGSYAIDPRQMTTSGYMPYPMQSSFPYDGIRSLLIEVQVAPTSPPRASQNGQAGRLMVTSSQRPHARMVAAGTIPSPLNPRTAVSGIGDNLLYEYELEFVRVRSQALSPWFAGGSNPDYLAPILATQTPPGTAILVDYRGADDDRGTNATGWSNTPDIADGRPFLQAHITFFADATTGAVPFVDTFVVPIR